MNKPDDKQYVDVISSLVDCMQSAITNGDWKVDGACDPDAAIRRAIRFLKDDDEPYPRYDPASKMIVVKAPEHQETHYYRNVFTRQTGDGRLFVYYKGQQIAEYNRDAWVYAI